MTAATHPVRAYCKKFLSSWDCKYHGVCIPKYRRKALYKELRQHLGEVLWDLASQKACRVEEGHLLPDHVHMLLSIPPICGGPCRRLHEGEIGDAHCEDVPRAT